MPVFQVVKCLQEREIITNFAASIKKLKIMTRIEELEKIDCCKGETSPLSELYVRIMDLYGFEPETSAFDDLFDCVVWGDGRKWYVDTYELPILVHTIRNSETIHEEYISEFVAALYAFLKYTNTKDCVFYRGVYKFEDAIEEFE